MTEDQAIKIMSYLKRAYPRTEVTGETIAVYADAIRSLAFEVVMDAARRHVATSPYFPAVSELIGGVAERSVGMEPAEQAWVEVKRAISRWGRYQEWKFDNPATTLAVESIGKEALCNADETLVAERAHFFRVYESYRQRELTEARTAPMLGRRYQPLIGAPKAEPQPEAVAAIVALGDRLRGSKP